MTLTPVSAISPIDGRYYDKTRALEPIFSEFGLMKYRLQVEVSWLKALADHPQISEFELSGDGKKLLDQMVSEFSLQDAERIKAIEATTAHDVKAVELFLREQCEQQAPLKHSLSFIHFACTSEDINNLAYALMLSSARAPCFSTEQHKLVQTLSSLADRYADLPMVARTHGQAASPTTLGKEMATFAARLRRQALRLQEIPILAKFNGAVGNFNAHCVAYPEIDWLETSKQFIESLGLSHNAYTTQIEPHDYIAELCACLAHFNTILIDFAQDIWGYIAIDYFYQSHLDNEVGSSTMPHKINPIDFENAEGNLALANQLLIHMTQTLITSRWQRDLTDSTLLRNLGCAFAYALIAYQSLSKGISKLAVNEAVIAEDLDNNWQLLTEAVQTVMRRHGIADAYDQLKHLSRGKLLDKHGLHAFIEQLELPDQAKSALKALTPAQYCGQASQLARQFVAEQAIDNN